MVDQAGGVRGCERGGLYIIDDGVSGWVEGVAEDVPGIYWRAGRMGGGME